MKATQFSPSELILNSDSSIYHLNLRPEDIAPTIITVGDPERVPQVSKYFDSIELKKGKREFITHTGILNGKRISVIATGIGTDNIDIVLNELDALVNIDFENRCEKATHASLKIIRIGTSGTFQKNIEIGSLLASSHAVGLDALMHYYKTPLLSTKNQQLQKALTQHFQNLEGVKPYLTVASDTLLNSMAINMQKGITLTAPGFYAPQGRLLRAQSTSITPLITHFQNFNFEEQFLSNLEMETAGIYALAQLLGHKALSINAILANRALGTFHTNPAAVIQNCIETVLEKIAEL